MAFQVTVKGGPDDGKSFRVDGQCIIGRAPRCQIELSDPSIAWEHAALQDQAGRLFIQNLSAAGTKHKGRPVSGETRVVHGDEIEVTPTTTLLVEEKIGAKQGLQLTPPVLLAMVVLLGVIGIVAFEALRPVEPPAPPMTLEHWRTAYNRLSDRMDEWESRGEFPPEAAAIFRDAWRLELAYNDAAAMERYEALGSVILTLPLPGARLDRRTIAEAAAPGPRALEVVMDWATDTSMSMDPQWRTDEAFSDALTWFIRRRANATRLKLESGQ